ncbi:hypothetical protein BGZ61DRAFT_583368, partial [Ilyonectria robusta]|uniref:uncharacterized protein n=1 Tax=Ilyonectria robusta TaxID=1079257 RepID=UPI001E8D37FD
PIGVSFIRISFWYSQSPRRLYEKRPDLPEPALNVLCQLQSGIPGSEHVDQEFHELGDRKG